MQQNLLEVKNLSVSFLNEKKILHAVKNISFNVKQAEVLALVGESGSGKSVTALSILQLIRNEIHSQKGEIIFQNENLLKAHQSDIVRIRGRDIAIIFQEPASAFNPLHTIGRQISEMILHHQVGISKKKLKDRIYQLLESVKIDQIEKKLKNYPHELSGGQKQRVMIAMAIANNPKLIIADEPTTALDVTIQSEIIQLLKKLQKETKTAILLITHDLYVVAQLAHRACVMKDGEIVEQADIKKIFAKPSHDYTKQLILSKPEGKPNIPKNDADKILEIDEVKIWFPIKRGIFRRVKEYVKAVDGISMQIKKGETIGIVGESGSGKTSLGLAIVKLIQAKGRIIYRGHNIVSMKQKTFRPLRKNIQYIFQDPFASLNPRMTVSQIIQEGFRVQKKYLHKNQIEQQVAKIIQDVGLENDMLSRYPHEFSGGQRQRIAIARAIILKPEIIILDEPTSALDMTVQQKILNLLQNIQKKYNVTYLFISHDLNVIRAVANKVLVMYEGKIVEINQAENIFKHPKHQYTQKLVKAAQFWN